MATKCWEQNFEILPTSNLAGSQSRCAKIDNFRYIFPIFSEVLHDRALLFGTKILFNSADVTIKSNLKNFENWNFGRILNFEILGNFYLSAKTYLLLQFPSEGNETW